MEPTSWLYIVLSILLGILLGLPALVRSITGGSSSNNSKKAAKAKLEPRGYSKAEVAKHATEGDLWLLIRPRGSDTLKVFDLSDYADQHPGGDAIYRNAGGDATEGFHGPQHPPTVHDLIDEYYIGWLEES